jgi:UDP-glucose 4-epimerase
MRVLVTGGQGSVGRELVPALLARDHEVVVLDREANRLPVHPRLRMLAADLADGAAVTEAAAGTQAIIHLAWSFSEDPAYLLEHDLRGHLHLLQAARREGVQRFLYASTAVVYGKPARVPVDEEHPLDVLAARRPVYGIAKEFAEKLTRQAARTGGPPAGIVRFWWAFGHEIGGRHLREMLHAAAAGQTLEVPAGCGGSFLSLDDLLLGVELLLRADLRAGRVYNLASAYVTWEEIAHLALRVTGGVGAVRVVPQRDWSGAAFLADAWELDDRRARNELGYKPGRDPDGVRAALERAMAATWARLAAGGA